MIQWLPHGTRSQNGWKKYFIIDTYTFYNYNRIDFPPFSITFSIIYDLLKKKEKKIFEILKSVFFFCFSKITEGNHEKDLKKKNER